MSDAINSFWQSFVDSPAFPPGLDVTIVPAAFAFGDNPALADQLAQLVLCGRKRATCSALAELKHRQEPLPEIGRLEIVLDGRGVPCCITRLVAVQIVPFNEVDATFAFDEGEDERTLDAWRREHWRYFSRVLPTIGVTPDESMPLVCE